MGAVTLYLVAFTIQTLATIAVIVTSSWEVATLSNLGIVLSAWASFLCLLVLACLSMVILLIQLIIYGCRRNDSMSKEDRHLTSRQYRSQAIFLGILSLLWLMASGSSTAFLLVNTLADQFGYVVYIGIVASWITSLFTIFMVILVIRIMRSRRQTADMKQ